MRKYFYFLHLKLKVKGYVSHDRCPSFSAFSWFFQESLELKFIPHDNKRILVAVLKK